MFSLLAVLSWYEMDEFKLSIEMLPSSCGICMEISASIFKQKSSLFEGDFDTSVMAPFISFPDTHSFSCYAGALSVDMLHDKDRLC